VQPEDELNARLVASVHPADWANPDPAPSYNLVVIGGGTAGLVSAAGAAGLGAKVALVERRYLGGDCLNFGCVPSKAILRSARVLGDVAAAGALGVRAGPAEADFPEVMRRMREIRARISAHDSARRFRDLGVDVFLGEGRFTSPRTVDVDGRELRFSKAVVATGARPRAPAAATSPSTRADRRIAFDGTQPKLRQSPPRYRLSTRATLAPRPAAPAAETRPAVPPPMTTRL